MYFTFFLWTSTSAAIQPQPGLSSSNVLCFIAIVAIVSLEQINHCHCHLLEMQPQRLKCYSNNYNNDDNNQHSKKACDSSN